MRLLKQIDLRPRHIALDGDAYTADYYLRGKQTGLSLYENYRWLPELTKAMVCAMCHHCGITQGDTVLDFGCARGYVVRAFRELGYDAEGVDCSEWAITNCDDSVRNVVARASLPLREYDWIIAKDVLEHIPDGLLDSTLHSILSHARRGFLFVVPLSATTGGSYVVPDYERDVTHVQRLTLEDWRVVTQAQAGERFEIGITYRVFGVKDNWAHHERGNGFLIGRRLED